MTDADSQPPPTGAEAPAAPQELTYHAPEGTELVRTFRTQLDMQLDEMSMSVNGEELPVGDGLEISMSQEEELVVRDVMGAPSDGRPERVERS